jgi:drug/metabolite transporter (DMT)-like permease
MAVFAGGNPVAVRFSNSGLPPFWGAAIRLGSAGLIFWILVLVRRIPLPRGRALVGTLLYGFLSTGAAYAFLYWGILRVPASLAGAILAFVPLMTFFFAWAHGLERFRWRGLIGALVATVGIVLNVVGGFGSTIHVPSVLALLAGTACLAEASVVFKLFPKSHPMATNAVAMTTGAPLLAVLSLLVGEPWTLPTTPSSWAAYAYLVVIGSVAVFYLYLYVLSRWAASATSYMFLLMPVATALIAAWLLGDVITVSFVIGAALVVAGVWVGAIRSVPEETAELTCAQMPSKAIC